MLFPRSGSVSSRSKQRASFEANGRSAAAKNSEAAGDSTTSNIAADLAPIYTLIRLEVRFRFFNLLSQRRTIQKRDVVGQRSQPIARQLVDGFLDLTSYLCLGHASRLPQARRNHQLKSRSVSTGEQTVGRSTIYFVSGRLSARPTNAPVASPSFTAGSPLTKRYRMPVAYWWGLSKVARSRNVFRSKTATSAN